MSKAVQSVAVHWQEIPHNIDLFMTHSIKRNLMDMEVISDCISDREAVIKAHEAAVTKASKWKVQTEISSKQGAQKHADEDREKVLSELSELVTKLVKNQFDLVWQASMHRFQVNMMKLVTFQAKKFRQESDLWRSSVNLLKGNKSKRGVSAAAEVEE